MDRVWFNRYPPGVLRSLKLDPSETLVDVFADACRQFPGRPAFSNYGRTLSFADMDRLTAKFAGYLQARLGLERGDRVAIMMPNLLQYAVAVFGILRAGMVVVNVNPLYTPRELKHQLSHSGAKAIVIVNSSAHVLEKVIADTDIRQIIVTKFGDLIAFPKGQVINFVVHFIKRMVSTYDFPETRLFSHAIRSDGPDCEKVDDLTGTDIAFLQYTGGTTGTAKGATLTHANMVANLRQVNAWFQSDAVPGEEIIITALPLYHVYALTCNCMAYMAKGGLNVLITDPRNIRSMIAVMRKWPFTAITGVNTLYQKLVENPLLKTVDFGSLKLASAGGMAVLEATAAKWAATTGVEILEGYGLSETSPVLMTNPVDIDGFNGSIGLPLPDTDVSLRDDDGNEVAIGETGEICVTGPQVMPGYWNNPEATAEVMTSDGYLMTGDLAVMDEQGFFRIVDRKKDMIVVSGFNVYPNEIENVLTQHPDVLDAACIGIPDQRTMEAVKAFVVLRPGASTTVENIRHYCKEMLTAYKVPRFVEFRDELAKTDVGKVLRRELREH
jgi:long-chain acyl-CoA synthetase